MKSRVGGGAVLYREGLNYEGSKGRQKVAVAVTTSEVKYNG